MFAILALVARLALPSGQRLFPQDETAMENLARYIRDPFSQLPGNDDHLYPAKRGTTPGMLTFSRKDQEYWAEGTGVPG